MNRSLHFPCVMCMREEEKQEKGGRERKRKRSKKGSKRERERERKESRHKRRPFNGTKYPALKVPRVHDGSFDG